MPSKFDPNKHHRRSIRIPGYDYSQPGAYFVTTVTYQRQCLFGEVIEGEMQLNEFGEIAKTIWCEIPDHFPNLGLETYVIMPNHVHGIIVIIDTSVVGARHASPLHENNSPRGFKPGSLGAIVGSYKSATTKRINETLNSPGVPVWQRNYYEHIIHNADDLNRIHRYIKANPANWDNDEENPINNSAL